MSEANFLSGGWLGWGTPRQIFSREVWLGWVSEANFISGGRSGLARDGCLPWVWARGPWLGTAVVLGFGRGGYGSGQLSSLGSGAKALTRDSCHPWVWIPWLWFGIAVICGLGSANAFFGTRGTLDLAPLGSRPGEFICFVGVGLGGARPFSGHWVHWI